MELTSSQADRYIWNQAVMRSVQTLMRQTNPAAFVLGINGAIMDKCYSQHMTADQAAQQIVTSHADGVDLA